VNTASIHDILVELREMVSVCSDFEKD